MSWVEQLELEGRGRQALRTWDPAGTEKGRVVLIHGLAEHSGRYERVGDMLAGAGFRVVAPDLYGFGMSEGSRGDVPDWEAYLDQVEYAVGPATAVPSVLMGHSMGGLICVNYMLDDRPLPDMAVLSAPALGGGAAWQKALAPVLAAIAPGVKVPNALKGSQLSRDPAVGEAYFADPLVYTKTSARLGAAIFKTQSMVQSRINRLETPCLVLHGGLDTIVPPTSTAALGDLASVERRLYPQLRHEVYNEPEGPELVSEVIDWVNQRLSHD